MKSKVAREAAEMMDAGWPSHDAIEERAYELYMRRPADQGGALDDWLQAERDLTQAPAASRARRSLRRVVLPDLSSK